MTRNLSIWSLTAAFGLVLFACGFLMPSCAQAQATGSWWGSSSWWDWSDFRAYAGCRMSLPRVTGSVEARGRTYNLTDFGITNDPEFFKSFFAEIYVDRLGFRIEVEEDHAFRGRLEGPVTTGGTTINAQKVSELDVTTTKLGLDLEIIRYPFLRAGLDFTYFTESAKFQDRRDPNSGVWYQYRGDSPMCLGLHGRAIPTRIRDVPVTIQGRVRGPVPFLKRSNDARIIEWEISGGLRPSIWSTSLLAHTTFSFGIEAGYRSTYLKLIADNTHNDLSSAFAGWDPPQVTAHWSGAFVQAIIFY